MMYLPGEWQKVCTSALLDAVDHPHERLERWTAFRKKATQRVIIADEIFDGKSLVGVDLSRCFIARCSFRRSNLSHVNFAQSMFRNCDAHEANIVGADFSSSDMRNDGLSLDTDKFDDSTRFDVEEAFLPDLLHDELRFMAFAAKASRRWKLEKHKSALHSVIQFITGGGFSMIRIALVGLVLWVLFAAGFLYGGDSVSGAAQSSASYFLTIDTPHNDDLLSWLGILESLVGILYFSLITAMLIALYLDR